MSRTRTRLTCRVLDYLDVVSEGAAPHDLADAFLQAKKSPAPIRTGLDGRSDLTFVEKIRRGLQDEGLSEATARFATHLVLTRPAVAVRRTEGPQRIDIVQAVLLQAHDEEDAVYEVTTKLRINTVKPPAVVEHAAFVYPINLDRHDDLLYLVERVEEWYGEHAEGLRTPTTRASPLPAWAWMGDPSRSGIVDCPPDWLGAVRTAGMVYDRAPLVATTNNQLRQSNITQRVEFAFAVHGTEWAGGLKSRDGSDLPVTLVGRAGASFAEVRKQLRGALYERAVAPPPDAYEPRDLLPGEVVYHRKVRGGRGYDCFDKGASSPCQHGAHSFKPFSAEQAVKGMLRRYRNFEASMLIHCKKYPNCQMYGVDASRGGLKPQQP